MTRPLRLAIAALAAIVPWQPAAADEPATPLSDEQVYVMMFVDQGRSYGYQTMMARIQLDRVKAELDRDKAILEEKTKLYAKNVVPLIELEIAQLKDAWNRKQLIVAEKSLDYMSAEYAAMTEMAQHFAGVPIPLESLYATFRRGWEAGCDKGPDEVVAMKAWADYAEKSLERARQLHSRGNLAFSEVLEHEAQLEIAQSNHRNREAGLEKCRTVLFPSLEQIRAIGTR
jgi:hypothetical protein